MNSYTTLGHQAFVARFGELSESIYSHVLDTLQAERQEKASEEGLKDIRTYWGEADYSKRFRVSGKSRMLSDGPTIVKRHEELKKAGIKPSYQGQVSRRSGH